MTVKKKVLIALLSTTCVAAAATGLAACQPGNNEPGVNQPGNNDPAYTVNAVDQNGNGVEGVTFRIGYYQDYTTNYVFDKNGNAVVATTDENGKATFTNFTPENGITYSVYLAEVSGNDRVYPYGYQVSMLSAEFDKDWHAIYEFTYAPSSFANNPSTAIEYYRTFDDTNYDGENDETMKYVEYGEKTITLNLKGGVHSYFTFQAYKELGTDEGYDSTNKDQFQGSEKLDYNQKWATIAAAGVYEVKFSASSNTGVTMYNFSGMGYVYTVDQYNSAMGNETPTNEIGVPYNKITEKSGKTGTIQLELTASGNISRSTQFFGIYSASDCTVTINLERTGDAEEPPEVETETVEAPENLKAFSGEEGNLTLMPIDGSLNCVFNQEDGYYHINSTTGPLLLVNLTATITRVGVCSIIDLGTKDGGNPYWTSGYIFSVYDETGLVLLERYDYSKFLTAYADKVDKNGAYPVDEELFTFLQLLANKGQMSETKLAGEYAWLLPCQYYMPTGGMDATGKGTQESPFVLLGTTNRFTLSESAYAQFTATATGIYTFAVSGCTVAIDGNKTGFAESGLLHICLAENEKVVFSVNGSGDATITVGNATANVYEPFFGDDSDTEGAEPSQGLTPDNAIQFGTTGYSAYVVNTSVCEDGVYVYVNPQTSGTKKYALEIKTPGGQIVYDGITYQYGDTLELTCIGGRKYVFLLTSNIEGKTANGVYAFEWKEIEGQTAEEGVLKLGTNSVTVPEDDLWYGVGYTFTAEESGTYTITTDDPDALLLDFYGDETYVEGTGHYVFTLEAGESFTFYCASNAYSGDQTYNVTIEVYTPTSDEAFANDGGTKHIVVHESDFGGIEFIFVSTDGGTYTISVADDANAIVMTDAEIGNKGGMGTVINTAAGTCSYEFTLEAGEYITFAGYATGYVDGEYDVTITKIS